MIAHLKLLLFFFSIAKGFCDSDAGNTAFKRSIDLSCCGPAFCKGITHLFSKKLSYYYEKRYAGKDYESEPKVDAGKINERGYYRN